MTNKLTRYLTIMAAALLCVMANDAQAQDANVSGSAGMAINAPDKAVGGADASQDIHEIKASKCVCVKCGTATDNLKSLDPVFCGEAANAQEFLNRVDSDKKQDGAHCQAFAGDNDECPRLAALPKFKKSYCTAKTSGNCTLMETADDKGISCRFECCGPNGCVAPDWQQTIQYTPYNDVPVGAVAAENRDFFFAQRSQAEADRKIDGDSLPYRGPQALCLTVEDVTALNANTCIGKGGRVDIVYSNSGVEMTHRSGVTAAKVIKLTYKEMDDEMITAIPYEYRDAFRAVH